MLQQAHVAETYRDKAVIPLVDERSVATASIAWARYRFNSTHNCSGSMQYNVCVCEHSRGAILGKSSRPHGLSLIGLSRGMLGGV